jgi:hypothetical protein
MLLLEHSHDGHHRFDKARRLSTVGAKAAFTPEATRTNRLRSAANTLSLPAALAESLSPAAPLAGHPPSAKGADSAGSARA